MKMVLLIYEAGIDEDVSGVLDETKVPGYTKLTGATGTGRKGHRFGTQVWPGTNNLLWIALPEAEIPGLLKRLEVLKGSYLKPPGLQVFIFPVDTAG